MSQIVAQVLGVQGRTTKNGKTVYDVNVSDGNTYVTFEAGMAGKASSFVGQTCLLSVNVEQKGNYTNRYLEDIGPQTNFAPQALPPQPLASPPVAVAPYAAPSGVAMTPEREQKIVKQSSFATAANLVGHIFAGGGAEALAEAEASVYRIARNLYAEVMGTATAQIERTPAAVQEFVNAEIPNAVGVGVPNATGPNQLQPNGSVIPW